MEAKTPSRQVGTVCTFYSFKGGVGRSMALANVAALLSKWGRSVLIVDFDLEAPGIEQYFVPYSFQGMPKETPGLVDLVLAHRDGARLDWSSTLCRAYPFGSSSEPVSILTAGRRDQGYVERLQSISWRELFLSGDFGDYLERIRAEWVEKFDFVLVDSRTGYTDAGGICTIQLPDILVVVLTTNDLNLSGNLGVIQDVRARRDELPVDRGRLCILPVPSRVESWTEYSSAREWHNKFQRDLGPFIDEWLPRRDAAEKEVSSRDVLDQLTLPHVAYWSFGEGLPVVEEGTEGRLSLGRAYAFLAGLIRSRMDYSAVMENEPVGEPERGSKTVVELAESAFHSLSEEEQKQATAAFARMVRYPEDPQLPPTVDSLPLREFPHLQPAMAKLAKANIILIKGDVAYLSDEVLLRSWKRLREAASRELQRDLDKLHWQREKNPLVRAFFALWNRQAYIRLGHSSEVLSTAEQAYVVLSKRLYEFARITIPSVVLLYFFRDPLVSAINAFIAEMVKFLARR